MEELRQEMHKCIEELGNLHPRTIKISQQLDILIVEDMSGQASNTRIY